MNSLLTITYRGDRPHQYPHAIKSSRVSCLLFSWPLLSGSSLRLDVFSQTKHRIRAILCSLLALSPLITIMILSFLLTKPNPSLNLEQEASTADLSIEEVLNIQIDVGIQITKERVTWESILRKPDNSQLSCLNPRIALVVWQYVIIGNRWRCEVFDIR